MTHRSQKIRDNLVHYAIYTIIGFILVSTILSFWNRHVTYDTRDIIEKADETKRLTMAIQEKLIGNVDLGLNSYLTSGDEIKLKPLWWASSKRDSVFVHLEKNLREEGFDAVGLQKVRTSIDNYCAKAREIIVYVKAGDTIKSKEALSKFDFADSDMQSFNKFKHSVFEFLGQLEAGARSDYEWSIVDNAIIQVILVLLSIPILIIASRKLGREVRNSHVLLSDLASNNKEYLYNDGEESAADAQSVIKKSIESFKKAFDFVENVSKGRYDQAQTLVSPEVRLLNQATLMGALFGMSTKLRQVEDDDRKRQWISAGLNEFYTLVRDNQNDLKSLVDRVVSFLTKYLRSQQGSLFTLRKENDKEYLWLDACFAYDRKKWVEKKIDIGDGLIGQAFIEGDSVMLTQVPNGYTSITSGLGDATPSCLLIQPFRYNDKIEAMFEVAGFTKYEAHHVEFLKKAGEILAAAMQTVKNNNDTQTLLQQSKEQAEILKSQEEELRQSMEELEATNEAMRRREFA